MSLLFFGIISGVNFLTYLLTKPKEKEQPASLSSDLHSSDFQSHIFSLIEKKEDLLRHHERLIHIQTILEEIREKLET
jgi:hypothetical protein